MPVAKGEFEPFLAFWQDKADFVDLQDLDDFSAEASSFNFTCDELYRRVMVWASGVAVCITWTAESYPYGNINTHTIKECWHSKFIKDLRTSVEIKNNHPMYLNYCCKMEEKN
jgi:hypothetical protein